MTPDGIPPRLSPQDEADLDRILENPLFQRFADDRMDAEFAGEGLSDATPDLETDYRYLHQVQVALHIAATALLEPGERLLPAYRIARERVANSWQQAVLIDALKLRYHDALLVDDHVVAGRIYHTIADAKYLQMRQQFAQRRAITIVEPPVALDDTQRDSVVSEG